jgi:hypothetical protein
LDLKKPFTTKFYMKKILSVLALIFCLSIASYAQVGIGINTPEPSAQLDVSSTERGFLPPRMTSAQRDLIAAPATGLLIFQTDNTAGYYYYNGTAWVNLGAMGAAGTNGTNGLNALIKTTTEAAGANCANGGTKIETGLDANGNGVLDAGEVNASQTKYVCNGNGVGSISAYSFDWKFPDGLANNIQNINYVIAPSSPAYNCCSTPPAGWYNNAYIVPIGYNLYITSVTHGLGYPSTSLGIAVNNVLITNSWTNNCSYSGQKNVLVGEGMQVSLAQNGFSSNPCSVSIQANFSGFLIPKSVTVIIQTTNYTVPNGYKFIKYDSTLNAPIFYLSGQTVPAGTNGYIIPN